MIKKINWLLSEVIKGVTAPPITISFGACFIMSHLPVDEHKRSSQRCYKIRDPASNHPYSKNKHHHQIVLCVICVRENNHVVYRSHHQACRCMRLFLCLSITGVHHAVVKLLSFRFLFLSTGWGQLLKRFHHIHLERSCQRRSANLYLNLEVFLARTLTVSAFFKGLLSFSFSVRLNRYVSQITYVSWKIKLMLCIRDQLYWYWSQLCSFSGFV